jgi:two-component system chemotaxis response regulator CheB
MAEVKLVRRWPARGGAVSGIEQIAGPAAGADYRGYSVRLLVVGASTGGPMVLQKILANLPAALPFPIAIVQHMAAGFIDGFVNWLGQSTRFPVRLAAHGATMLPGHAYVAPDGVHLRVREGGRIDLSAEPPVSGLRPAVGVLFQSAAQAYGRHAGAVLLTGMGSDGAHELKHLKDLGAATVIQDKASSVVFGMPGAAELLGAACWTLPPERIAELIARFAARAPD